LPSRRHSPAALALSILQSHGVAHVDALIERVVTAAAAVTPRDRLRVSTSFSAVRSILPSPLLATVDMSAHHLHHDARSRVAG
jgi:hypothetical protein